MYLSVMLTNYNQIEMNKCFSWNGLWLPWIPVSSLWIRGIMSRMTGCSTVIRASIRVWIPWPWPVCGMGISVWFVGGLCSRVLCGSGSELWHLKGLLWWPNAAGIIDDLVGWNGHVECVDVLPSQSCYASQEIILRIYILQCLLSRVVFDDLLCNFPHIILHKLKLSGQYKL